MRDLARFSKNFWTTITINENAGTKDDDLSAKNLKES